MIGNPNYNYWNDGLDKEAGRRLVQSEKRIGDEDHRDHGYGYGSGYDRSAEKTSVKVSNPPGGRQSLRLG